jgi:hypothetical protein
MPVETEGSVKTVLMTKEPNRVLYKVDQRKMGLRFFVVVVVVVVNIVSSFERGLGCLSSLSSPLSVHTMVHFQGWHGCTPRVQWQRVK